MEVQLVVPVGTDVSIVSEHYPDLYEDEGWEDEGIQCYWCGNSGEEYEEEGDLSEWMTYDECVEFCGFCEGAIEDGHCTIEGNGGWAQGMISRRDFSGLAITDEEKVRYKAISDRYWEAYQRGEALRKCS